MKKPANMKVNKQAKPAKETSKTETNKGETIHTINPFTGNQVDITPQDLEGIEKWNEAQTERD